MAQSPREQPPACYRLRIGGHLDHHWSAWFDDLTLIHESDGTTSLSGRVVDQAQLHGLLVKVRDLGVTLISVVAIDLSDSVDDEPDSIEDGLATGQGALDMPQETPKTRSPRSGVW